MFALCLASAATKSAPLAPPKPGLRPSLRAPGNLSSHPEAPTWPSTSLLVAGPIAPPDPPRRLPRPWRSPSPLRWRLRRTALRPPPRPSAHLLPTPSPDPAPEAAFQHLPTRQTSRCPGHPGLAAALVLPATRLSHTLAPPSPNPRAEAPPGTQPALSLASRPLLLANLHCWLRLGCAAVFAWAAPLSALGLRGRAARRSTPQASLGLRSVPRTYLRLGYALGCAPGFAPGFAHLRNLCAHPKAPASAATHQTTCMAHGRPCL
jgi:hypothetical protein